MVLRFQWMDIEQDLTIYDKDKETLLDLILDWEAECAKAGKEMPLQARFYYLFNNEVQWLDWDDDLFKMFAKFPIEEMIVVFVVEVEEETKLMNSVRSLKKLQEANNPQPVNDKNTDQQPIELSITEPTSVLQEIEPDNYQEQPIALDNPPQSEQSQNYSEIQQEPPLKVKPLMMKAPTKKLPRLTTKRKGVCGKVTQEPVKHAPKGKVSGKKPRVSQQCMEDVPKDSADDDYNPSSTDSSSDDDGCLLMMIYPMLMVMI